MEINNLNGNLNEQGNESIDLRKLFGIAKEKKVIVFAIIVICTVIAIITAFLLPKTYESTTLVRVKSSDGNSLGGAAAMAASLGINIGSSGNASPENYIAMMQSRDVLAPIMEKVDMPDEAREKMTSGDFAKSYLDIVNEKKTDLISIGGYGKTPEEAQMVSQSVTDNFISLLNKLNKEDSSYALKFLDERMQIAKGEMEDAENKLEAYQQEKGIYAPDVQTRSAIEQINKYDASIAQIQVQIDANTAKLSGVTEDLNQQNASLLEFEVSDNDNIGNIRESIVNKRVQLVSLQQKYTEEHPDVIRARAELDSLEQSLSDEIAKAINSQSVTLSPLQSNLLRDKISTEIQLAVDNASLEGLKEKQSEVEKQLSDLSADGVEYVRLSRQANITSTVYTDLVKSYEQIRIQNAKDSMAIQVIDKADLPKEDMPVKPKKKIIAAIGLAAGIMIAFGYTLVLYSRRYGF